MKVDTDEIRLRVEMFHYENDKYPTLEVGEKIFAAIGYKFLECKVTLNEDLEPFDIIYR